MPRKILFFTHSLHYGGDDTVLINLVRAWPEREDRLIIALNAGHPGLELYRQAVAGRAEVKILAEMAVEEENAADSSKLLRPWRSLRAVLRLRREIAALAPEAIFLSTGGFPLTSLSWRMLLAARLSHAPQVVLVVHNYPYIVGSWARRAYLSLFGRLALRLSGQTVTVSQDCARVLEGFNAPGRPPVACIHNGIEPREKSRTMEERRAALGGSERPLIGAVGNLHWRKGFKHLILAMKRVLAEHPEARLVIIGAPADDTTPQELRALIDREGLSSRVTLAGFLPDAGQYVECFDVCVIPSVTHENFCMTALEAMQYAKPVIATRVGGNPEAVAEGRSGRLVAPENAEALAAAILELLGSPETAGRLGEEGRRRWSEFFTAEQMAKSYNRLIAPQSP